MSYDCSKLQSITSSALVKHLLECNKVLQTAVAGADRGLTYKAGLLDWEDSVLMTITDASWAGETLVIDDKVFPRRSQH